jgi:tetratricopeptide (TPR) repeat protein
VARGQFVAAEAVLEKACIALPESFELMVAQADLAHRQRNWAVSEHRWQLLKQRFGSLPKIVAHLADALRHQKKFDAAEAMLSEALLSEPGNQDMAEMFARIAEGRTDFAEADRRWAVVAQRFPSSISARVAQITARVKLGDLTGAEAVAAVAADMFPNNEQVLAAHARVATHAANWPEALLRWNRVRSMAPQHADYWWQQARALRSQRRDADARLLLAEAAKLFPDNRPIILLHAELLTEAGF